MKQRWKWGQHNRCESLFEGNRSRSRRSPIALITGPATKLQFGTWPHGSSRHHSSSKPAHLNQHASPAAPASQQQQTVYICWRTQQRGRRCGTRRARRSTQQLLLLLDGARHRRKRPQPWTRSRSCASSALAAIWSRCRWTAASFGLASATRSPSRAQVRAAARHRCMHAAACRAVHAPPRPRRWPHVAAAVAPT